MNTLNPQIVPKDTEKPWGFFRQFTLNENSTVKILHINKGEEFSLQSHSKRAEFWRVVQGSPVVTVGTEKIQAKIGDEFFVAIGIDHRISAIENDVEVLEISTGEFDENDIKRIEDKYGRI